MRKSHGQLNLKWRTFTKKRRFAVLPREATRLAKCLKSTLESIFDQATFAFFVPRKSGRSASKNSHALFRRREKRRRNEKEENTTKVIDVGRKATKKRKEGEKEKNTNDGRERELNKRRRGEKRGKIKRALFKKKKKKRKKHNLCARWKKKGIYWTAKYIRNTSIERN